MALPTNIGTTDIPAPHNRSATGPFGSFAATSPLAQSSIARDIQLDPEDARDDTDANVSLSLNRTTSHSASKGYSMAGSYRRPSFIAAGTQRSTVVPSLQFPDTGYLTEQDVEAMREDERSLLRDNQLIRPKHPRKPSASSGKGPITGLVSTLRGRPNTDEEAVEDTAGRTSRRLHEDTPLLGGDPNLPYGGQDSPEDIDKKWEEAIEAGMINTTWQREAKVIAKYSRSLVLTFILQYSLPVASVFAVGHLGTVELGAVSLGTMTAGITGYSVYQGLATSLDTLCAQAYGSGHKKLVGLQLQRMVIFLWLITIPIGIIWLSGTRILTAVIPEKESAELAGLYLKVVLIGAPGYATFESGKRFMQAQGLFTANLYVLMVVAPLNAFLHWLFVWRLEYGFVGAPMAVAITENLMPIGLFLYVYFVDGRECWGGFSKAALQNWGPMIKLAIPGLLMLLAEWLAFEILTLSSSFISGKHLAAQSVLSSICALAFQVPFPMSVAASTRVANLIGATLADAAKLSAKVALVFSIIVGAINMILLSSLRSYVPQLFTSDPEVIAIVAKTLPLCAAFQLFDSWTAHCNGILRGIGRQEFGGYVNLFFYYAVAMPISFGLGFGLHYDLIGLWAGPAVALGLVGLTEGIFIYKVSWQKAVEAAKERNEAGGG